LKITKLETFLVAPRWLFLRMETDDGVIGWGEPVIEGRAHTVATAVDELSDYLLGLDPSRIEDHWQVMTKGGFYRGGPILSSAVAGIDQALWDIKGKVLGVPVHDLLGGAVRDRVRVYSWIAGDEPDRVAEHAAERIEAGFTAVKMNATGKMRLLESHRELNAAVDRVAAVRAEIGPDRDIAVDFHGRLSPALARELCRLLEPLHPMFVEEPLVPELTADLARLCDSTTVPIATGERLYSTLGLPRRPVRRHRCRAARPFPRRRHIGVPTHRIHGRGPRCRTRAALPAGTDLLGVLPAGRPG